LSRIAVPNVHNTLLINRELKVRSISGPNKFIKSLLKLILNVCVHRMKFVVVCFKLLKRSGRSGHTRTLLIFNGALLVNTALLNQFTSVYKGQPSKNRTPFFTLSSSDPPYALELQRPS
jgi:hypothetical protein